jgi:hypothetical protein
MGGFYGSIQVRTTDRAAVKAAAELVAGAKKIHCMIGPELNGWVGIYPENNGQDDSFAAEIARQIDADVLHLMVHDDDVLAYWLWRNHELVDSYWSKPGYFGEENREAEEKRRGDPEQFRAIIGDNADRLEVLLEREESTTFESERLERFAKLLGIQNAVTAYEYLREGERAGVKGWRQFEEIPAEGETAEKAERRAYRKRLQARKKSLLQSGMLLVDEAREIDFPHACAAGDRLLVFWSSFAGNPEGSPILSYRSPWEIPQPIDIGKLSHISGLAADAAGHRVAIGGEGRLLFFEMGEDGMKRIAELPESEPFGSIGISSDGRHVVYSSRKQIIARDIETGDSIATAPVIALRETIFHPSGDCVITFGPTIGILNLAGEPRWREIHVGGKNPASARSAAATDLRNRNINVDQVISQWRTGIMQGAAKIRRTASHSAKLRSSFGDLRNLDSEMEKLIVQQKIALIAAKEGRTRTPVQPNEPVICAGFSRDGQWLLCGTQRGLCALDWKAVVQLTSEAMPAPAWRYSPSVPLGEDQQLAAVTAVAQENDNDGVVFSTGAGTLYRFDPSSGEVHKLTVLPARSGIYKMLFSGDGKSLGILGNTLPDPKIPSRRQKTFWQIWSYTRLLEIISA